MSECFLGEIRMFAGNYAPEDWVLCNGQAMNLQQNEALYSLLGTVFGGDNVTTFNAPDMRGRIPIGQGTGSGLTQRTLGQTGGDETVTITQAQMPAHSHVMYAANTPATTQNVGPTVMYAVAQPNTTASTLGLYSTSVPPAVTPATGDTNMIAFAGGGQAHNNTMMTTCISYIMAILGTYPPRA